jgi:hypothetical protein
MSTPPKIDNAPGLTWKPRKKGWEARWQARTDLIWRGYEKKSERIWCGVEPTEFEISFIQDRCTSLQADMLVWSRGGLPVVSTFDGTLRGLMGCYRSDKDSKYRKLRFRTRQHYDALCASLENVKWIDDDGAQRTGVSTRISELKARVILRWHETYINAGHVSMGHSAIGMLRILVNFGATILESEECMRLAGVLSKMEFAMPKPRVKVLMPSMAVLVRKEANALGFKSVALTQAFQSDCMFRQKDVIGEWVPHNEPGPLSDVLDGNNKWIRGIRWEEIDNDFILTHITSKRQKEVKINLRLALMVMEELGNPTSRDQLPAYGPIIKSENSGIPWHRPEFLRHWRMAADRAGVPKSVKNMDSRAGAITEATLAGAPLESIKHAATHSDIAMTQRYGRGAEEKTADVMNLRNEYRNKTGS